jgi:hypothetical protein
METTTINRDEVLAFIDSLNGAIFYTVYTSRKTGEVKSGLYTTNSRKYGRTGQGLAYDPRGLDKDGNPRNLVQVCDVHAARRRKAGVLNASGKSVSDDRMLPIEGIQLIRTNGTTYTVTD